jgi:electron transfer flavoprotein alpha subunit
MAGIVIDHAKCIGCQTCVGVCPFGALSMVDGRIEVSAACKLCKACIGACPVEAISFAQIQLEELDKSAFNGVMVYVEHNQGRIHPITYELIGKARQLAGVIHQPVYAVFIGSGITDAARTLLDYGVDEVVVYDDPALAFYRQDNYANAFSDAVEKYRPVSVLVGSTTTGRSMAPTVATRFHTGLTADTTVLQMRANTDMVQIRPAFGGNIMAQILTANSRPQFATVRYKVMDPAAKVEHPTGRVTVRALTPRQLASRIRVLNVEKLPPVTDISAAEIVVVAGSGVRDERGLAMVKQLAQALGGVVGYTRPMVEKGIGTNHYQIGLSGRTVKAKLIITVGVSGAIQFVSGMQDSELIMAINSDPEAPIFKTAHVAVVGDLYEILPQLLARIAGKE